MSASVSPSTSASPTSTASQTRSNSGSTSITASQSRSPATFSATPSQTQTYTQTHSIVPIQGPCCWWYSIRTVVWSLNAPQALANGKYGVSSGFFVAEFGGRTCALLIGRRIGPVMSGANLESWVWVGMVAPRPRLHAAAPQVFWLMEQGRLLL